jgi:hypothetical protein
MAKRVASLLAVLMIFTMVPILALAQSSDGQASESSSETNKAGVLMTQERYDELKTLNELPTDVDIEIVDDVAAAEQVKIPEGAVEIKGMVQYDKFVQLLKKQFGPDLQKEIKIDDNTKVIQRVEIEKQWVYPKGYEEPKKETSLIDKINSTLTPSALAICKSPTGGTTASVYYDYYVGGLKEAITKMTYTVNVYEDGFKYNYYLHPVKTTGKFWRANTEYTVKNAKFEFYIRGDDLCSGHRPTKEAYSGTFTPTWTASTNYTSSDVYTFNGDYTNWPALRGDGGPYTRHLLKGDLYHRNTKVASMSASYTTYN